MNLKHRFVNHSIENRLNQAVGQNTLINVFKISICVIFTELNF